MNWNYELSVWFWSSTFEHDRTYCTAPLSQRSERGERYGKHEKLSLNSIPAPWVALHYSVVDLPVTTLQFRVGRIASIPQGDKPAVAKARETNFLLRHFANSLTSLNSCTLQPCLQLISTLKLSNNPSFIVEMNNNPNYTITQLHTQLYNYTINEYVCMVYSQNQ